MKKSLLLASVLAGATVLSAQQSSYSVTVDFPFVSKYVFRGVQINKESFQPSVEISSGNGYLGLWTSFPITEENDDADETEIDVYLGYNFALSDTISMDVGGTMYYYPQLNTLGGTIDKRTYEAYVGFNFDIEGFTPALYAYYDFTLKSFTLQGSAGYSFPLTDLGTSLDVAAALGYVDGDGFNYTYWSLGATVPYKLADNATFNVGVSYAGNDISGADKSHFWFTVGLTVGF